MSIESKHAYRFGYLKSEQWKTVRLEALVREKGRCQICGEESIMNDAHHVWYPKNIYETTESHLVILCRPCHDFLHCVLPECKTNDESKGRAEWLKFFNAVKLWRTGKAPIFNLSTPEEEQPRFKAAELRKAYKDLKDRCHQLEAIVERNGWDSQDPDVLSHIAAQRKVRDKLASIGKFTEQKAYVFKMLEKWSDSYSQIHGLDSEPLSA